MEKVTEKAAIPDKSDVLVVGAGYLGRRVAQVSLSGGARVYATTRRKNRMDSLLQSGFHPIQFDWTDRRTLKNLPRVELSASPRVLISVSFDRTAGIDRHHYLVGGLRNLLRELADDARICYISTTGVYHQTDGGWVDETSPTRPIREAGRAHLRAEALLHGECPFRRWTILRLAGIYGPGRVPRAADVIAGRKVATDSRGFLNLIHVNDAASSVVQAWSSMQAWEAGSPIPMRSRLYCVSDDVPVRRADFYREVARQAGAPDPIFEAPQTGSAAALRGTTNKRIWNRRFRRHLAASLQYPDYRSGLADLLHQPLE